MNRKIEIPVTPSQFKKLADGGAEVTVENTTKHHVTDRVVPGTRDFQIAQLAYAKMSLDVAWQLIAQARGGVRSCESRSEKSDALRVHLSMIQSVLSRTQDMVLNLERETGEALNTIDALRDNLLEDATLAVRRRAAERRGELVAAARHCVKGKLLALCADVGTWMGRGLTLSVWEEQLDNRTVEFADALLDKAASTYDPTNAPEAVHIGPVTSLDEAMAVLNNLRRERNARRS